MYLKNRGIYILFDDDPLKYFAHGFSLTHFAFLLFSKELVHRMQGYFYWFCCQGFGDIQLR